MKRSLSLLYVFGLFLVFIPPAFAVQRGNGACGASNGDSFRSKPTTNLCSAGTPSSVTGDGPWSWTCRGVGAGRAASCSTSVLMNGACGSANKSGAMQKPTTNLCSAGSATTVKGTGPWAWNCKGSNGGNNASCTRQSNAVKGRCGSANGRNFSSAPTNGFCSAGAVTAVSGTGPWSWSCDGSGGGGTSDCSARTSVVKGTCGYDGPPLIGAYLGDPGNQGNGSDDLFADVLSSWLSAWGYYPRTIDIYVDGSQEESAWVSSAGYAASSTTKLSWAGGMIPTVGFPMASSANGESAETAFSNIISGSQDNIWNGMFQQFQSNGFKTIFARFGLEFNGNWEPYSVTASNVYLWSQAWQHLATLAHNYTGLQILTVWNPNYGGFVDFNSAYPGDAYVDIIAIDAYGLDQGGTRDSSVLDPGGGSNFSVLAGMAMAASHGKSFGWAEVGAGTNDTTFPDNIVTAVNSKSAKPPVAFFNIWDDSAGGNSSLKWTTNPITVAAWKAAFAAVVANSGQSSGGCP